MAFLKVEKTQFLYRDEVRFDEISSEYIMSVDLHWALNISIFSDNPAVVQNMKERLTHLFGDLVHW